MVDAVELARRATDVGDPEPSLEAIAELRRRLDELEAFQVERALRHGWSWARIGRALGRTRQAVHKRYARLVIGDEPRHDRVVVTDEAQRVVALARAEVELLGAPAVGPEHLAVGLVAVGAGPPGLTVEAARAAARDAPRRRPDRAGISAPARRVLEQSLRECVARGELELRPEHLMLALTRAPGRNVRTAA